MLKDNDFFSKYYKSEGICHPQLSYHALSYVFEQFMEELDPVDKIKFQAELHPFVQKALQQAKHEEKDLINNQDLVLIEANKLYTINPNLQKKPEQKVAAAIPEKPINQSITVGDLDLGEWPTEEPFTDDDIPFGLFASANEDDLPTTMSEEIAPQIEPEEEKSQEEVVESMRLAIMASSDRMFGNITGTPPVEEGKVDKAQTEETSKGTPTMQESQAATNVSPIDIEDELADSFMVGKVKP
ncbi:MAG: hypothetical protein PHT07_09960 [Paludibacter sp.]|nr:hypothetical protein [Paludibacter sp.]